MAPRESKISVLTGDIVNSTQLTDDEQVRAHAALARCADMVQDWADAPLCYTRHRGDGWQVVISPSALGLRSALAFRAAIKALGKRFDTTIGIGDGIVEGPIPTDLNIATGTPFVQSGRALEKTKRQTVAVLHGGKGRLDAVTILAATISDDWTPAQSAAIYHALSPLADPVYTEIGAALGKSRQAVTKALDGAKCNRLRSALTQLESDDHHV